MTDKEWEEYSRLLRDNSSALEDLKTQKQKAAASGTLTTSQDYRDAADREAAAFEKLAAFMEGRRRSE